MSPQKAAYPDIIIPRLILVPCPGQYVACDEAIAGYRDDLRDLARSCLGLADFLAGNADERSAADLRSIGTALDSIGAGLREVGDLVLESEKDELEIENQDQKGEIEDLERTIAELRSMLWKERGREHQ